MQKFSNKKKNRKIVELLVENEIFENVDIASRNIMAGNVVLNNKLVLKVGETVDITKNYELRLKNSVIRYVSRGGLKLEKAIINFKLDFKDKIVLDVGSSTGGFTDCAIKFGAKKVYSVDVGTNQLHWTLRNNEKVKSIENMHIKNLKLSDIENSNIDFVVMDVSFISILSIIEYLIKFLSKDSKLIFLIKPQFEVENKFLEKGIVKSDLERKKTINRIVEKMKQYNLNLQNITISPIKGAKGNIEYLSYFSYELSLNAKEIDKILEY